jgi:Spy/CpxP family protein refolding chaperone
MLCRLSVLPIVLAVAIGASAQVRQQPHKHAAQPGAVKLGPDQFEFLRGELKITDEQKPQWDGLIENYKARVMEEALSLLTNVEEMKALRKELETAEAAGNEDRAAELRARLDELRPEKRPTQEFFAALNEMLTPEQREALPKLRAALEEGKLSLIDLTPRGIARIAESLELSDEQRVKLAKIQDRFREQMQSRNRRTEANKRRMLSDLIGEISLILTPEQAEKFKALTTGGAKP